MDSDPYRPHRVTATAAMSATCAVHSPTGAADFCEAVLVRPATVRVAFLGDFDLSHEIRQHADGLAPAHRLLGAGHAEQCGAHPTFFTWPGWWPRRWRSDRMWRLLQAVMLLLHQHTLDAAVCLTDAPALPVLTLKRLGLVRIPIVVLTVAVLKDKNLRGVRRRVVALALPAADRVFAYASAQVPLLVDMFKLDPERVHFLAFGVDIDFFPVVKMPATGPDVLVVGTNEGKDLPTLLDALPISASCVIVTDEPNVQRARAHGIPPGVVLRTAVPITELRELYRGARHIVLPLNEQAISSGQTVLLENLVSGRAVIVSDVSGVADYLVGTAAIPVRPADPARLHELLLSPGMAVDANLVQAARDRFDSRRVTQEVVDVVKDLVTEGSVARTRSR